MEIQPNDASNPAPTFSQYLKSNKLTKSKLIVDYYPIINAFNSTFSKLADYELIAYKKSRFGQDMTGNAAILRNPFHVPTKKSHFHFFPSIEGCPGKNKTSISALSYKCDVAMNAGFFDVPTGGCLGKVVSDSKLVQNSDMMRVNFGITQDGRYVIGYLNPAEVSTSTYRELISGAVWLVRQGKVFVNQSRDIEHTGQQFISFAAPRTSIGFTAKGELVLLEMNGMESLKQGPSLYEMAQILIEDFGVYSAINLDGGGSSTFVAKGTVLSECCDQCATSDLPNHCPSSATRCERKVTTINCIKN